MAQNVHEILPTALSKWQTWSVEHDNLRSFPNDNTAWVIVKDGLDGRAGTHLLNAVMACILNGVIVIAVRNIMTGDHMAYYLPDRADKNGRTSCMHDYRLTKTSFLPGELHVFDISLNMNAV